MNTTRLELTDQVNCRFHGLDPATRRRIRQETKFWIPWAPHTPQFKAKWWDGYEYLFDQGGRTYIELLDRILPLLIEEGWEIDLDDQRDIHEFDFPEIDEFIFAEKVWPKNHKCEGEEIILREHQVEALKTFTQNVSCVQVLPTSSGKTIITAAMSALCEPYGKTLVIVPNKSLVNQTEEDYQNLGLDVGVYYGDRKELGHTHTICTWQILNLLDKKKKRNSDDADTLLELVSELSAVIVDEVHQAKAKALKNLLSGVLSLVPIRWGLTGTMPKDEYDSTIIRSVLGPVVNTIKPKELQDIGILSNCEIYIKQLKDDFEFGDYHTELSYLVGDKNRLEWTAKFIQDTAQSGNTLILVSQIKTGKKLQELIPNSVFISGQMKVIDRKDHYDEVHEAHDKVIIATYGVASVGINIPRIFNLILFEPGKSFIRVIQSIGRGLRVAKDKDHVQIFDITSTCKFSKRHLTERKKFYKEMEYPFQIEKVDWK